MEMFPKVGVGVFVLNRGKVLLARRKNSHGEGDWALSGGHLEFGETIINCTCRELFEETGLKAENVFLGPWKEVFFPQEKKHYLNIYTFVTQFSGELTVKEPSKTEEWFWFETSSLPSPLFLPVKKLVINQSLDPFLQEHLLKKSIVNYLSAPFNHPDPEVRKQRYALITEVAGNLIHEGTFVFSPITHNVPIRELGKLTTWEDWRDYDLTMLDLCKKMILLKLPGWESSKGVQAEIAFAEERNIPIVEMNVESLV